MASCSVSDVDSGRVVSIPVDKSSDSAKPHAQNLRQVF